MARSIRSAALDTRTARLRLPVAPAPVYVKIGVGLSLGYRRNRTAGAWVVRVFDGKGGKAIKNVGQADDFEDANGDTLLDFWQAQQRARKLATGGDDAQPRQAAATAVPFTVAQAIERYAADLKTRRGDHHNARRVTIHLGKALAGKNVALLTVRELRDWRDALARDLAASTVNRIAAAFKAALNLAADQDERIANRRAWEIGLATIADANESRNVILRDGDVLALVEAARAAGPELGLLVELAAVTGARYSQLARLDVQDLQNGATPRLMMPASRKGNGSKKIGRHPVPVPVDLAARLAVATATRAPGAPLLVKSGGDRWRQSDHTRPFARAVKAAGLDPAEVTIYALRHSSIVRQILAGVPVRVVAVNHDTSILMIERTYSRHIGDHSDSLARAALLDTRPAAVGEKVVPIRRG